MTIFLYILQVLNARNCFNHEELAEQGRLVCLPSVSDSKFASVGDHGYEHVHGFVFLVFFCAARVDAAEYDSNEFNSLASCDLFSRNSSGTSHALSSQVHNCFVLFCFCE